MRPATEILLSAAFVLTPPENFWRRGMPHNGWSVCAFVALCAAGEELYPGNHEARWEAIGHAAAITKQEGCATVIRFNDSHTHAEVLDALYRAAELSESS